MTRAYRVKGKKRKNRDVVEKYHREEKEVEDEEQVQPKKPNLQKEEPTQTPTSSIITEENKNNELIGIPIAPPTEKNSEKPGVIFILEKASLEIAKVGKTYQLLNPDEHASFLLSQKKKPDDYRPDICHQALLSILDSPLNKAGRLKMVYIRTEKGVLIEVRPDTRIPRTFKRFAGLMLQLLQELRISDGGKRLLRIIKNPVTQYLPTNSWKAGLSSSSKKVVNMKDYLSTIPSNLDLVFVVGAMAYGKVETDYTEDYIAVSEYQLTAAYCIARICNSIEGKWNIL
ncbi:ribosomal RNA small subunit methyltransferase NEP1-like [Trifolium pratense]|nr:ribosomal RNA small subunit methyltransferase NEP1-like [Trifolium pratense]XP_045796766.1 ribosomal RNA small subunit methyltransferase NEP1-like [Trifolium pratense]XP_045796767.1 ribosomal RNA small subunit methyltransferase NEP1-like [Trifolium pratense]